MRILRRLLAPTGFVIFTALAFAPFAASAVTLLPPCTKTGDCGITDILAVFINIAEFLLAISGAVALGYFIWGGFQFILAGGKEDMVKTGKETIVRATIGIAIILLSGVMVRFVNEALTGKARNVCTVAGNKSGACVAKVGDTCKTEGNGALWVSLPAGYTGKSDNPSPVPESLECIEKSPEPGIPGCEKLNKALSDRNRLPEGTKYSCVAVDNPNVLSCVRGLCGGGAGSACCLCNDGHGNAVTCAGGANAGNPPAGK